MAAVSVKEEDLPKLENLGLKDSKLLSPLQREGFFERLKELDYIKYEISICSPQEIDDALNSPNLNLNSFEALHSALLINKLKPNKVMLDLPSNNAEAYIRSVTVNLTYKPVVEAEHKADANYAAVSAASIFAKVTRDREVAKLKQEIGIDFGSGYPSDPKTISFLKEYHSDEQFGKIFRKTWASYKNAVNAGSQKGLGDF